MLRRTLCGVAVLLITSLVDAAPYNKYGRSCKDIGCRSNEVCVMERKDCGTYESEGDTCGRYPTCKRSSSTTESCTSLVCPAGQYCRSENGIPTCVSTLAGQGYDSAGVSIVNGQPSQTNNRHDPPPVVSPNANPSYPQNPYSNANAPPIPPPGQNYPVNSATNLGYPPDPPSNRPASGSGSTNLGYPAYPSNSGSSTGNTNLGYPPYPTVNRMPNPGQTNYPQPNYPQPNYPQSNYPQSNYPQSNYPQSNYPSGYPQPGNYPVQQYPGHQNYPTSTQNRGYNSFNSNTGYRRKSGCSIASPTVSLVLVSFAVVVKYFS
ncbi:adhesive plaque matrix protein-like isoform X4 [Diprion similis]|uniref:adhesive plaque matrix protein-like isoform X4 n=1 Tax=Diprion similis TaxID=362088 RepID=UPI001EF8DC63|nr:adhesive plaque matrix protein-like isoform X4 [Diprion similis]